MQRNKVHHVRTVGRVARDLGVEDALIDDDDGTLAFSDEGIREVRLILEEYDHAKPSGT